MSLENGAHTYFFSCINAWKWTPKNLREEAAILFFYNRKAHILALSLSWPLFSKHSDILSSRNPQSGIKHPCLDFNNPLVARKAKDEPCVDIVQSRGLGRRLGWHRDGSVSVTRITFRRYAKNATYKAKKNMKKSWQIFKKM